MNESINARMSREMMAEKIAGVAERMRERIQQTQELMRIWKTPRPEDEENGRL
jgi:hypothetical protein